MAKYLVKLPVTARAVLEVEADDEDGAIEAAFEAVALTDIEEWEALRTVSKGNVLYAISPWEAEAELA